MSNFTNFFKEDLVGTYSNTDTTFTIGDASGLTVPCTIVVFNEDFGNPLNAYNNSAAEICEVTSKSVNDLTVTRGAEGTTAITIGSGTWKVIQTVTSNALDSRYYTESEIDSTLAGYLQNVSEDTTPQLGGELDAQGNSIVDLADVTFRTGASGGTLRTGTANSDKFVLEAYDVNDSVYRKVIELDAGNDVVLQMIADYLQIEDAVDNSKEVDWDLSGMTTGVQVDLIFNQTVARQITFPDATGTIELEGHTHATSDITSGTFADARISQSSVTQHQSALSITESQISDLGNYSVVGHTHTEADITDLKSYLLASDIDTLAELNAILTDATLVDSTHTHTESDITDLDKYTQTEVDDLIDEDWTSKSASFNVNTTEELNYVNTSASGITATVITGLNQIYVFRQGGAGTITLSADTGVTLLGDTATANQHDRIILQPTETANTYYCKLVPAS